MATQIASAYVQIIPSAKGISGALGKELGGEAASAGSSAGNLLGSNLVGTIGKVVAAAGIGKLIADSISAGADLEQSIGGVETLFGAGGAQSVQEYADAVGASVAEVSNKYNALKEVENTVLANADNAWKTAGLSANDYMQTVTSFTASLKQSVDDNMVVAEIADQAVIDMADNANKMGTSMESIQNAYMGFAKQNYTMLDNLKLGYGGTKSEMERLLEDAARLKQEATGEVTNFDISNLADVYEAIHIIQDDLGITGTTAKEAAETFSGSMSAMKSAASNLMAKLALGDDIRDEMNSLAESVMTFGKNLFRMLGNLLRGIPSLISGLMGSVMMALRNASKGNFGLFASYAIDTIAGIAESLITGIPYLIEAGLQLVAAIGQGLMTTDWAWMASSVISNIQRNLRVAAAETLGSDGSIIDGVLNGITTALPNLLSSGVEIITGLANGILQALPGLITTAGELVTQFAVFILDNGPAVLASGVELVLNLVNGIIQNLPAIAGAAIDAVASFLGEVALHLPEFLEQGITLLGELIAGLIAAIPDLLDAAGEIVSTIWDKITNTDWLALGKAILDGIVQGIKNFMGSVGDAIGGVVDNIKGRFNKDAEIGSPSKLFMRLAEFIPQGMALGIRAGVGDVTGAVDDVVSAAQLRMSAIRMDNNVAPAPGINSRMDEFLERLENLKIENSVRLEGDARGLFKSVKRTNYTLSKATGANMLAGGH